MKYVLLVLAICISTSSWSDEKKHRKIAEEIFEIQNIKQIQDQVAQSLAQQEKARIEELNLPPEAIAIHEDHFKKVMELIASALSWDYIKEDYLNVYMSVYNEKESKAILKFYKTKVGRKTLDLQYHLMQEFQKINQQKQQTILPQLSRI